MNDASEKELKKLIRKGKSFNSNNFADLSLFGSPIALKSSFVKWRVQVKEIIKIILGSNNDLFKQIEDLIDDDILEDDGAYFDEIHNEMIGVLEAAVDISKFQKSMKSSSEEIVEVTNKKVKTKQKELHAEHESEKGKVKFKRSDLLTKDDMEYLQIYELIFNKCQLRNSMISLFHNEVDSYEKCELVLKELADLKIIKMIDETVANWDFAIIDNSLLVKEITKRKEEIMKNIPTKKNIALAFFNKFFSSIKPHLIEILVAVISAIIIAIILNWI